MAKKDVASACKELRLGKIPSPTWVKDILQSSACNPSDDHAIRSSHVFWKEYSLRVGLVWVSGIAWKALVAFNKNEKNMKSGGMFSEEADDVNAQKDLLAYLVATESSKDIFCGIVRERRNHEEEIGDVSHLEDAIDGCFGKNCEVGAFVKFLRNGVCHGRIMLPHSNISLNFAEPGKLRGSGRRYFDYAFETDLDQHKNERPKEGKLRENARKYFDSKAEQVDGRRAVLISKVLSAHFAVWSECRRVFKSSIDAKEAEVELDFRKLQSWPNHMPSRKYT